MQRRYTQARGCTKARPASDRKFCLRHRCLERCMRRSLCRRNSSRQHSLAVTVASHYARSSSVPSSATSATKRKLAKEADCSSRVQVLARSVGLSRDCCIVGVATSELQQLRSTVNSTLNARRSRSLAASAAVAPLPTYTSRQNDSAIRCPSPTPRLSPSRD